MKTALNKILLIVLLLCLTVLSLTAQTGKFYSTNNELSSSLINQIFQDKRGFIWIATEYGLNRFDGLRFSTISIYPATPLPLKTIMYARFLKTAGRICW